MHHSGVQSISFRDTVSYNTESNIVAVHVYHTAKSASKQDRFASNFVSGISVSHANSSMIRNPPRRHLRCVIVRLLENSAYGRHLHVFRLGCPNDRARSLPRYVSTTALQLLGLSHPYDYDYPRTRSIKRPLLCSICFGEHAPQRVAFIFLTSRSMAISVSPIDSGHHDIADFLGTSTIPLSLLILQTTGPRAVTLSRSRVSPTQRHLPRLESRFRMRSSTPYSGTTSTTTIEL